MKKDKISKKEFIFGAGGHAKVVIDIAAQQNWVADIFLFDDAVARKGQVVLGYSVCGGRDELLGRRADVDGGLVAIGNNMKRREIASWLRGNGLHLDSFLHPSVQVAQDVTIESGTVVMAGGILNPSVCIGEDCIINTGASVDHDCRLGKCVHVAPGAVVCGGVRIGDMTLIGAGATILPNIVIGKNVVIGAGVTVRKDVESNRTITNS